jgi:hypothetical protein
MTDGELSGQNRQMKFAKAPGPVLIIHNPHAFPPIADGFAPGYTRPKSEA